MRYQEGDFESFDRIRLYEQGWLPDGEPKALVVMVHGSFEHSGRYQEAANFFVGHGYSFLAFDLRGHGRSSGERAFIASIDEFLGDLETYLKLIRRRYPQKPVFLFGHSLGGSIAIMAAIRGKSDGVIGIVLSAPVLKIGKGLSPLLLNFTSVIGNILPRFKIGRLNAGFLSVSPKVVSSYKNDPLVYKEGIVSGAIAEFVRATNNIQAELEKIDLPVVILHGTADRFSDVEGSRILYERIASEDKTLKLYEDYYHELFQEPYREKVFGDVLSWMDKRLSSKRE
jgi:alpha-beta hydrolase superfamily lysophospholipase